MKNFISSVSAFVISVALIFVAYYVFLPPMNFRSGNFYTFIAISFAIIGMGQVVVGNFGASLLNEDVEVNKTAKYILIGSIGIILFILLVSLVGIFCSAKIFHSSRYKEVAQIEMGNFADDFVDISQDSSNLAIVDQETAIRVGDRTIGNLTHASWYEVDEEYNLITYQGKQYRVSPLNYGSFFKYRKAVGDGYIPGYVLVDSQSQESFFVEVDGGIKYSPSAYFSYNLCRQLRKQYPTYIFDNSYFEVDENGNPYWITAVKTPTVGIWGCKVEKSFIVTNAVDGTSQEFAVESLPEWVDHSFSLDYLTEIAYWHYEYANGYINFSKTGVYRTSYYYKDDDFLGYNSFVNADGEVCFYVGLSPANTAETNVGFLLVNTKTGKFIQYDCSGAEESSSQKAAEGLVQNLGYYATFPTVVNVAGEETYLMCLKDKAGLIQRYALCNIENYSVVVEAETIDEVIELYSSKLGLEVNTTSVEEPDTVSVEGKIYSVYTAEIDGTTVFYYQLENDEYLYKSSITKNERQVLLKEGDSVTIEYVTDNSDIRIVTNIKF